MIKFLPILLPLLYAFAMYRFSVWRTGRMLDAQSAPLKDARLEAVVDRMAQALDLPRIVVHVYDVDPVNGLAAPDGRIFLTRGFIDRYKQGIVTAEEIGSVVAHELGHVALGHTKRRMIDVTGQNAVFMLLAGFLSRMIPIVGVWVAQLVTTLLASGLSRKAEHEADAYASALLVKSG
ncbi:MAG: putative metalloprotease, partial [Pseudorhodobacter sp.]